MLFSMYSIILVHQKYVLNYISAHQNQVVKKRLFMHILVVLECAQEAAPTYFILIGIISKNILGV